MRNFISIQDLSRQDILDLLVLAKELKEKPEPDLLKGKIVATLFEPSTRTRLSFTSAAYRIGANVLGFDSIQGTSVMKGESFEDTIRMVSSYSDVIVIRHPQDGTAQRAANISSVPVINAGDGKMNIPVKHFWICIPYRKSWEAWKRKNCFRRGLEIRKNRSLFDKSYETFSCKILFCGTGFDSNAAIFVARAGRSRLGIFFASSLRRNFIRN